MQTVLVFCFLCKALSDYTFYVTCALISVVSLLPVVAFRFYRTDVTPTLADKARLLQRQRNSEERKKVQKDFKVFSGRRSRYESVTTPFLNIHHLLAVDGGNRIAAAWPFTTGEELVGSFDFQLFMLFMHYQKDKTRIN